MKENGPSILFTDPYHKQVYHMSRKLSIADTNIQCHGIKLPYSEYPVSVDVDYANGKLVWIDGHDLEIQSSHWDGSEKKVVYKFDKGKQL